VHYAITEDEMKLGLSSILLSDSLPTHLNENKMDVIS